ncbi:hypothetical protein F5884DRAFT_751212 [Xylogone sp. PMI_703]|nr:hypothetical protein F5884DRAFT_751212 [Xylogone sp. PMI_703]
MPPGVAVHQRVRTGCGTCRKRRVKCDERRPSCRRCHVANVICEGYPPPRAATSSRSRGNASSRMTVGGVEGSQSAGATPSQGSSCSLGGVSLQHPGGSLQSLPYYHQYATSTVFRLFRPDHVVFWQDWVCQMSWQLDIVYQALVALGAAHHIALGRTSGFDDTSLARHRVNALNLYGRCLTMLQEWMAGEFSTTKYEVTAIVTVLLACFECLMDGTDAAFRHLWSAIQIFLALKAARGDDSPFLCPIHDTIARLDFTAQLSIPFGRSSYFRTFKTGALERPFWWPSDSYCATSLPLDHIAAERHRLLQLISGYSNLSKVVWGAWYTPDEQPSRIELEGFMSELTTWKENAPYTFTTISGHRYPEVNSQFSPDNLTVPPPPLYFTTDEAAVTVLIFNVFLTSTLTMICKQDEDYEKYETTIFHLIYQNLCITQGLLISRENASSVYKPCESLGIGAAICLYLNCWRCYDYSWQEWTILALQQIGKEGLFNGHTLANTLIILQQMQDKYYDSPASDIPAMAKETKSPLGPLYSRLMTLQIPSKESDTYVAYYLRHGDGCQNSDGMQVVAQARWGQDNDGHIKSLKMEYFGDRIAVLNMKQAEADRVICPWRTSVERGWHSFLNLPT